MLREGGRRNGEERCFNEFATSATLPTCTEGARRESKSSHCLTPGGHYRMTDDPSHVRHETFFAGSGPITSLHPSLIPYRFASRWRKINERPSGCILPEKPHLSRGGFDIRSNLFDRCVNRYDPKVQCTHGAPCNDWSRQQRLDVISAAASETFITLLVISHIRIQRVLSLALFSDRASPSLTESVFISGHARGCRSSTPATFDMFA